MFLMIFSCSKEINNNIPAQQIPIPNDRLAFQNPKDFNNTYSMLSKFKTEDELRFWAQSKTHTTLLDSQDSIISNYSWAFKTIFSKDYEFEFGDSIVLFNKGDLYAYSKKEANKISLLDNPNKFRKIGVIRVTAVGGGKETKSVDSVSLGIHQNNCLLHPFTLTSYQPCGGVMQTGLNGSRQYVSQLYDETTEFSGVSYDSHLYLYIKLEEHPSSGWRTCLNQREVKYQVSGNAIYKLAGQRSDNPFGYLTNDYHCDSANGTGAYSGPLCILLAQYGGTNMWGYVPSWEIYIYGFIYQHVLGDPHPWTIPVGATFPYNQPIW